MLRHLNIFVFTTALMVSFAVKPCAQGDSLLYNSLLWEISGNGLEQPSYLYGTMHVSEKLAFHLSDEFYEALESCDVVALELNPETWMDDLIEVELSSENYQYSSSMSLYSNFYKSAFKTRFPTRKNIASSISEEDFLINSLLYRSDDFDTDFEENTYLDLYIFQTGQRMGLDIFSLENYREVSELSLKAMEPHESDEELDFSDVYDRERSSEISLVERLENSYRDGNLDMVDSLSKLMNPYHNFQKYMIVERNITMANRMDSLMQQQPLFTGIGAAHLPGQEGVIELLRALGYQVNPLQKGVGGKSRKYEQKYDKVYVNKDFKKQTTSDGMITVKLPGPLYELPSSGTRKAYMHPDMANGMYYWVKRIKSYGPLQGHSTEYQQAQIDSLLYESIPGEIMSQETITKSGFQGYDIRNRTRKGDMQRYQILITPLELLIFKMGGTGDQVKQYGDRFFDSIKINQPLADDWDIYSPIEKGFEIKAPSRRIEYRLVNPALSGGPGIEMLAVDDDEKLYMLRLAVLHDHGYLEEDSFELDMLLRYYSEAGSWEVLFTEKDRFQGCPSIHATLSKPDEDQSLFVRIFIRGTRYFMLSMMGGEIADAEAFFEGFKFTDFVYESEFEEYRDTTLGYVTRVIPEDDQQSMFSKSHSIFGRYKADKNPYEGSVTRDYLRNGSTGEEVLIQRREFERYYYADNIDEVWNNEIGHLTGTLDYPSSSSFYHYYGDDVNTEHLYIESETSNSSGDVHELNLVIADSLSERKLHRKYLLYGKYLFSVETTSNDGDPITPFAESAFNSFELDTALLEYHDIFGSPRLLYLSDVSSPDTLLFEYANEYSHYFHFKESDYTALRDLLDGDELDQSQRLEFVRYLSHTGEQAIGYYHTMFLENQDNFPMQLEALRGLANIESRKSYQLLSDLVIEYVPIPAEVSDLRPLYGGLRDSLELAAIMIPDWLELNVYDEYKDYNWDLLWRLSDQGIIRTKDYSKHRKTLINLARHELKRAKSREQEKAAAAYRDVEDSYDYVFAGYGISELTRFAQLIVPWYSKDARVKEFFDEALQLSDTGTRTRIATILVRAGHPVPTSHWSALCEDLPKQQWVYRQLESIGRLDLFPVHLNSQRAAAEANVWRRCRAENDSSNVAMTSREIVDMRTETKAYYFFKVTEESYYDEGEQMNLYYVGPFDIDETVVNWDPDSVIEVGKIKGDGDDEQIAELTREAIESLKMQGRSRYRSDDDDGSVFSIGFDDF